MKKEVRKTAMFWSGGKDSAFCLYKLLSDNSIEVCSLITTINADFKRISMHGIREAMLDRQVKLLDLPHVHLMKMYVISNTNMEYEEQLKRILITLKKEQNITHVVFGDIFLEDLRLYREKQLAPIGLKALFPLWGINSLLLARNFISQGFRSVTCCVNDGLLDESYCGVEFDEVFLSRLPVSTDPCGENGEFHSFCYDGPLFKYPVKFKLGERIYKPLEINFDQHSENKIQTKGFWYIDIMPV